MTTAELLALYDRYERRGAAYPDYERNESARTIRMTSLDGGHNFVIWSALNAATADDAISAEQDFYSSYKNGFEWKLYSHDQPANLKELLAAQGFSIGEDEAVMVLELDSLPEALRRAPTVEVRKALDEITQADYAAVNKATWPDDDGHWVAAVLKTIRNQPERMSAYVAYIDGLPVCAARIDFPEHSPFASIWGGATLEAYRKQGAYTAVLAARAQEAVQRGYKFLTIDASPMSRPIAEKYGFRLLAVSNPCDWKPGQ